MRGESSLKRLIPIFVLIVAVLAGYFLKTESPRNQDSRQTAPRVSAPETQPSTFTKEEGIEIRNALRRIKTGERKFKRDGTTFQNREARLPQKPAGYYKEYTVLTRGVNHRGARRIVCGNEGELYYTSDHYRTFIRINEQGEPGKP